MRWTLSLPGVRRLADDRRGVALLEFAFVLPFLVLLFIGGFQLLDAISAYRKVGTTVRALSDLTSQNSTMNGAQADTIIAASAQVMSPYSPSNASLRISQIQVDALSQVKVSWSRASAGTTAYTAGAVFTALPPSLLTPSPSYVLSEITYTYTPHVAATLIGTIPLSQVLYMSPRYSPSIVYTP